MSNREVKLKTLLSTSIQNGYSPICPDEPNGVWILGLGALTDNGINTDGKKPAPLNDKTVERFLLKHGDFLISRSNTLDKVGRSILYRGEIENCSYPDLMMKFRVDETKIYSEYLEFYLRSPKAIKYLQASASGTSSTMVKITKTTVEKIPVWLPSYEIQVFISNVGKNMNQTIATTERLIEAKERYFKEISKKLLSLQKSDNWNEVKLGTVCDISKGVQLSRSDMIENAIYPVLNGGIQASGYTDEWNTDANTITISEGGNSCGFVSYLTQNFWCGGHCYALKQVQINQEYLYHYLKANEKAIMSLRVGSGLPNIQKKALGNFHIRYPKDEVQQSKIAEILNTAKREIDLLKKLVASYRVQKRGLMQKLLNGEWRVAG